MGNGDGKIETVLDMSESNKFLILDENERR